MPSQKLYPVFLNLKGRHVLVVGGGVVGARKADGLLQARARVTIVSPAIHETLQKRKQIVVKRVAYSSTHMRSRKWSLVFTATDVPAVNRQVQKDAEAAGILCCRCDDPDRGDFNNGASTTVGPIVLSISTGGASPGLSARIRDAAAHAIDPALAELARLHHAWRPLIKQQIRTIEERKAILQRLSGDEMIEALRKAGPRAAEKLLRRWLKELQSRGGKRATISDARRGHG